MQANGEHRVPVSADTRGKHRILAELKRFEQEARFLEVYDHFANRNIAMGELHLNLTQVPHLRDRSAWDVFLLNTKSYSDELDFSICLDGQSDYVIEFKVPNESQTLWFDHFGNSTYRDDPCIAAHYLWTTSELLVEWSKGHSPITEELEELERTERVSAALEELLQRVESRPDPLLPITTGPTNPTWDRWFEGPQDMHGCKCWIL